MDQIRIGTDIKLKITLEKLFGISDRVNIKRAKCFLINKTMLEQKGCSDCHTAYTLHSCAVPRYYGFPHFHYRSHWHILPYNGFGIYPDWHHVWHRYNFMHHYNCCDTCGYELQLPVKFTTSDDVVIVDFPAFKQKHLGVYKLTFVFDVYVKGYNEFNIKTVTVDYDDAFELIANDDTDSMTVEIVNNEEEEEGGEDYGTDNYVVNGSFDYEDEGADNTPKITLNMNNGEQVKVDMSDLAWSYPDAGSIHEGNPYEDID